VEDSLSRKTAKPKRRTRAARKGRRPSAQAAAPGLNAESRAQLGPDPERRPYRPRDEDASIEDPLQDWPQDD
jgi:hypothetical protein